MNKLHINVLKNIKQESNGAAKFSSIAVFDSFRLSKNVANSYLFLFFFFPLHLLFPNFRCLSLGGFENPESFGAGFKDSELCPGFGGVVGGWTGISGSPNNFFTATFLSTTRLKYANQNIKVEVLRWFLER